MCGDGIAGGGVAVTGAPGRYSQSPDERPVLTAVVAGPTTSAIARSSLLASSSEMNQFNTRDSAGASFDAYAVSLWEPEPY